MKTQEEPQAALPGVIRDAIDHLRHAMEEVRTYAEPGPDQIQVVRGLTLLIANLEGIPMRACKDCNAKFALHDDEARFYREHDMKFPLRCRPCRAARRQAAAERAQRPPRV